MHASRLYLLLFSLYWAQGLPVGFMTHALPVILRAQGVSLAQIGGFGLLMLPWSIKILWAPWVDRLGSSRIGHYRSWIIPMQVCSICGLVVLAYFPIEALNQPQFLLMFFVLMLWINFSGATQDIATDALAVNLLKTDQQHWGNTFQVIGSRLGFIVGGGVLLWAVDALGWQNTFLCLATLVALNTLPIVLQPARQDRQGVQGSAAKLFSIRHYLQHFLQSKTTRAWLTVLLSFKVADGLAGPLLKPLMVDIGLSFTQIGLYITVLGAVAALLGAFIAGYLLQSFSRAGVLLFFLIVKILTLIGFAGLGWAYESGMSVSFTLIYALNALEDLCSAMLLVVMLTLVMHYSRSALAGTDFTFQVALMATVSGGFYLISGVIADQIGYAWMLSLVVVMAILSVFPIYFWSKTLGQSQASL
ncbi:MFS transporter [Acinetobacter sp. ACZLY 512]|uniref:MFS transporter n=1 Tax=Acinetobacter sp. ACZLY 512 TaxID=2911206 RepID=UPI002026E276|nr:MFS transporter [Acinetobacter sp. ACZLY 512]MCL9676608.1 MFS transporter [Acinetobacter sp. ACZLY 512]